MAQSANRIGAMYVRPGGDGGGGQPPVTENPSADLRAAARVDALAAMVAAGRVDITSGARFEAAAAIIAAGMADLTAVARLEAAAAMVEAEAPAGASLLWDGLDTSSLFQTIPAPGTTPVTTDTNPVGVVRDVSGSGNHLAATANSGRFTYNAGSLQRLRGPGTTSGLRGPPLYTSGPWTIGLVWRMRVLVAPGTGYGLFAARVRGVGNDAQVGIGEVVLTNLPGYQQLNFCGLVEYAGSGSYSVGTGGSQSQSLGLDPHIMVVTFLGGNAALPERYIVDLDLSPVTPVASGQLGTGNTDASTCLGGRWHDGAPQVSAPADFGRGGFYPFDLDAPGRLAFRAWMSKGYLP